MFDPDSMRKRFHDLGTKRDEILAKSAGARAKRDEFVASTQAEAQRMSDDVKAAEAGLFEIEQERAFIARALGGKVGAA